MKDAFYRIIASLLGLFFLFVMTIPAISQGLPRGFAPGEEERMAAYLASRASATRGILTPPPFEVRTSAEWEEVEYLLITWTQFPQILREIVRHAREECKVLIFCGDSNNVKNYLSNGNVDLGGVYYHETAFNSIWIRDYGSHTVYQNAVDSVLLVDWIYNRPRPLDDIIPDKVADFTQYDLYTTGAVPYDLVNTGGNFMTDGFGTGFSSRLVINENGPGAQFVLSPKDEQGVDSIMDRFMGIDRYIKMTNLPYDGIHHIDMHMKLLDEETLLIGEYPQGIADGPQIEANISYVLNNYPSMFGTPYKIQRVEMPPTNGYYPPSWQADYRTFTNSIFINKTILVPTYEEQYDTTALRIMRELMPGYKIVGINCNAIIPLSGALHCITKLVGVQDPLLISHQRLDDTYEKINPYSVQARIQHRSGIQTAHVFYRTDTSQAFLPVPMSLIDSANHIWEGFIPPQLAQEKVQYFIAATAHSGKQQFRPMPAPAGYWEFEILGWNTSIAEDLEKGLIMEAAFPNPASAITCVPLSFDQAAEVRIALFDLMGREVHEIYEGKVLKGEWKYFFNAQMLPSGPYFIQMESKWGRQQQQIIIR